MATGFMKRNKTTISKIKKMLETELNKYVRQKIGNNYISVLRIELPKSVIRSDNHVLIKYNMYVKGPQKVILKEFDSRLVFGMDLRGIKYELNTEGVRDTLIGKFGSDYTDGEDNIDKMYNRVLNYCESDIDPKLEIRVGDGQYPFVKDRNILPIFVVDENDGVGFYIVSSNVNSYRQGHQKLGILNMDNDNARRAVSYLPMDLAEVFDGIAVHSIYSWW